MLPQTYNPLKKGKVAMPTKPECAVKYIAVEDIGRASAVLLMMPEEYAGKKIDADATEERTGLARCYAQHTGLALDEALSEVSGVACKY